MRALIGIALLAAMLAIGHAIEGTGCNGMDLEQCRAINAGQLD